MKPIKTITSADNAIFRGLRESLDSKGIRKHRQFMIFGARAIHDTLTRQARLARNLVLCNEMKADEKLILLAGKTDLESLELARPLFEELDVFGTGQPILVLQTPELPDARLAEAPRGLEILCALSDPANVGALLRSAAAFGASRVVLLKESASPFHPRAVRAASATTLETPLMRGPSIRDLGSAALPIVALDMNGRNLGEYRWPSDARLLLGEEGLGVPRDLPGAQFIKIPMAAGVESLNATVAASIALFSYRTQLPL